MFPVSLLFFSLIFKLLFLCTSIQLFFSVLYLILLILPKAISNLLKKNHPLCYFTFCVLSSCFSLFENRNMLQILVVFFFLNTPHQREKCFHCFSSSSAFLPNKAIVRRSIFSGLFQCHFVAH